MYTLQPARITPAPSLSPIDWPRIPSLWRNRPADARAIRDRCCRLRTEGIGLLGAGISGGAGLAVTGWQAAHQTWHGTAGDGRRAVHGGDRDNGDCERDGRTGPSGARRAGRRRSVVQVGAWAAVQRLTAGMPLTWGSPGPCTAAVRNRSVSAAATFPSVPVRSSRQESGSRRSYGKTGAPGRSDWSTWADNSARWAVTPRRSPCQGVRVLAGTGSCVDETICGGSRVEGLEGCRRDRVPACHGLIGSPGRRSVGGHETALAAAADPAEREALTSLAEASPDTTVTYEQVPQ